MSRWENLPPSDKFKPETTTTSTVSTIGDSRENEFTNIAMHIGEFLRQELNENNRISCAYRNLTNSESPILLICELGCCPTGCCAFSEYAQHSAIDYSWALLLLAVFVSCIVISSLIMLILHCFNKRRDHRIHGAKSHASDSSVSSTYNYDFGSGYSQTSTSSQLSPQIYHCNTILDHQTLPSFYPTTKTFKSAF